MKVALVYDRVNTFGGAERVLLALHDIYPNAPLYTAVYDKNNASWANVFSIVPSWMNSVPFARTHHQWFPWLTPFAFESFDFSSFDVVITVTSAEAKMVVTKPETLHICYCLTPTRYLWSGYETYKKYPGFGYANIFVSFFFQAFLGILRHWDSIGSKRPDEYVAISKRVGKRIEKYYHVAPKAIIYPPVDCQKFTVVEKKDEGYFLVVRLLVPYKRVDIIIKSCMKLHKRLVIIGNGPEYTSLKNMSDSSVTFVTKRISDETLHSYYQACTAFVFVADEDFGIVAVEAQACGKPVIAYKESGIAEIVIDENTGILFSHQSVESMVEGMKKCASIPWNANVCRKNALRFDETIFKHSFAEYAKNAWKLYNTKI